MYSMCDHVRVTIRPNVYSSDMVVTLSKCITSMYSHIHLQFCKCEIKMAEPWRLSSFRRRSGPRRFHSPETWIKRTLGQHSVS